MNISSIAELIGQVELFKDLPASILDEFTGRLTLSAFQKGNPIIKKGENGDSMYVIVSGKVKVHDEIHTVAELGTGNFFGEFSLLDAAPRSMSVSATEDVVVAGITRDLFYNLLNKEPDIVKKIISVLTQRLRHQNQALIHQLRTRQEELSRLVEERTAELKIKNIEISNKNKEITDNINYAKRIQTAILPEVNSIYQVLPQSFFLYLPKDIVSGDFYSFFHQNNAIIIAAADCTGHGVTGALLSVIGNALLSQLINEKKMNDPDQILDQLNLEMIKVLKQRSGESNDGMDIAVCCIDQKKKFLGYAGANRPLWLIRKNKLHVFQPDKFPVGGMQIKHENGFTNHLINLEKDDTFYLFTDGFADQFGGEKGKKLMTGRFKELLLEIQKLNMRDQEKHLKAFFENWKGHYEQVDDVLIIGIRI